MEKTLSDKNEPKPVLVCTHVCCLLRDRTRAALVLLCTVETEIKLVRLWETPGFSLKIRLPSTPVPEPRKLLGFQPHSRQYHESWKTPRNSDRRRFAAANRDFGLMKNVRHDANLQISSTVIFAFAWNDPVRGIEV